MTAEKSTQTAIFVSPHLDDAVLSAGGLISRLVKIIPVEVVTVFTQVPGPAKTASAKRFVKLAKFSRAEDFFAQRRREDKQVLGSFGVNTRHLGYRDVLWRQKPDLPRWLNRLGKIVPELTHIYPIYDLFVLSGRVANEDSELRISLAEKLAEIFERNPKPLVFTCAGVGRHVDHCLVRQVCEKIWPEVILWSDFPYSLIHTQTREPGRKRMIIKPDWKLKRKMIAGYTSQAGNMFPGLIIPKVNEKFFVKTKSDLRQLDIWREVLRG